MTGIVHPLQRIGMIHKMWNDIGKPAPFALVQELRTVSAVCVRHASARLRQRGIMRELISGAPMEVVEMRDLGSGGSRHCGGGPSEGAAYRDTEMASEGPMGEYAGYMWSNPGIPQPVYDISAIPFRNQAILPITVNSGTVDEDHTAWGLPLAAEALTQLREHGIPATLAWVPSGKCDSLVGRPTMPRELA